ncbi:MAG: tol-pal system protein YbgF [Nitrospirota bacterium]
MKIYLKRYKVFFVFMVVVPILYSCALQSDLIDLQLNLDRIKKEQKDINKRLGDIKGDISKDKKPLSEPPAEPEEKQKVQEELAEKFVRFDKELQAIQGKIDENKDFMSQSLQNSDEQSGDIAELKIKVAIIEERLASLEERVSKSSLKEDISPEQPAEDKIVLPGKSVERSISSIEAYNLAYNDYIKGNYDLALMAFKDFITKFSQSTLVPNAQYWIGECYYSKKEFIKAIDAFKKFIENYPDSEKVSSVLLKQGNLYYEIGDKKKAKSYLKKVIEKFPFSNEAKIAKNRLSEIR